MKAFFEAPQKSVKMKFNLILISKQLSEIHGTLRVKDDISSRRDPSIITSIASELLRDEKFPEIPEFIEIFFGPMLFPDFFL